MGLEILQSPILNWTCLLIALKYVCVKLRTMGPSPIQNNDYFLYFEIFD